MTPVTERPSDQEKQVRVEIIHVWGKAVRVVEAEPVADMLERLTGTSVTGADRREARALLSALRPSEES